MTETIHGANAAARNAHIRVSTDGPRIWPTPRPEDYVRPWSGRVAGTTVEATEVLASYWRLASERQRVYHARLAGQPGPWTTDPVISRYRFTNAYRAADRVSQDLIRVIYAGSQRADDLLLRILVYRFFNKPTTWDALETAVGDIGAADFNPTRYAAVLDRRMEAGDRIYSAAYIVPPPPFGHSRKHRNHLALIEHMMCSGLAHHLARARSLEQVFHLLTAYPSLGPVTLFVAPNGAPGCWSRHDCLALVIDDRESAVTGSGGVGGPLIGTWPTIVWVFP